MSDPRGEVQGAATDVAEARAVQRQALAFRLQCRLDFMAERGMESVGISKGLATELVQALTDRPAETSVDRVCHDEQMAIWTGEIAGDLSMGGYLREDLSYDDKLDIHAVIAANLRSIIGSAFLQAEPPAPVDEPAKRENAIAVEGRSPAGAVAEGQAPDLKALQAEIERLKADAEGWRSLWFDANRATSAWAYQACKDKIALQDSECRRVEESKRCDKISSAFERFCKRTLNITDHQKGALDCGLPRDAAARIWQRAQAHRQERLSSTPTQETPNAQG